MSRVLAFDFGEKRTGIAVSDELQTIAFGLTTIPTENVITFIKSYIKKEEVELFLIGKPKQMDNSDSESEALISVFIKNLEVEIPQIPYKRIDERFTSKMASQTILISGLKKKRRSNKALIDEISAIIILQSYLYNR